MRKTLFSIAIVVIIIAGLILFGNNISKSSSVVDKSTTYTVKFHLSGCDGCSGVTYCIDGGGVQSVNSCFFTVELTKGKHSICARCPNNKVGFLNFEVVGDPFVQDVWVNMSSGGSSCTCQEQKN